MLTIKDVPLDSITLREDFFRRVFDPAKHTDLLQSIKARGIIYPLITIETPEGLTLVAGYRRYKAAKELSLATVPCICLKVGIDDAEIIRLHENLYREDISPVEEAEAMARLETTYHFTRSKIANLLGKSASYVTQRLAILHWHPDLRRALSLGQINYSVARELYLVTDEKRLRFLIEQIISSGASVRTVANWVLEWKAELAHIGEQASSPTPVVEMEPTSDEPTSCFVCSRFISRDVAKKIIVCGECLAMIEAMGT